MRRQYDDFTQLKIKDMSKILKRQNIANQKLKSPFCFLKCLFSQFSQGHKKYPLESRNPMTAKSLLSGRQDLKNKYNPSS